MNPVEENKAVEKLYVQTWLAERIEIANFNFVDHMQWMLNIDPRYGDVFGVTREDIAHIHVNPAALRGLLRAPFLMIAPTLQGVEDWRCFVDDTPTTRAVDDLRRLLPVVQNAAMPLFATQQRNQQFLELIITVINMSVLAAPLLGIPVAVAEYLASVPAYKLHVALQKIGPLPLFRWRFTGDMFWYEFASTGFTDESLAHQIMLTSPGRAGDLPHHAQWSELRLGRTVNESYAGAMMAHGCRASTASTLFRLNPNLMRKRYFSIHGVPSPCGNSPNSMPWFVESATHRVHATFYTWLYRSALAFGANTPQALIATNDIYSRVFSARPLISADRGYKLTASMAADSQLAIAPCRSCGTHYVISNNDTKIEMRSSFMCPACAQQLGPRRASRRKVATHDA